MLKERELTHKAAPAKVKQQREDFLEELRRKQSLPGKDSSSACKSIESGVETESQPSISQNQDLPGKPVKSEEAKQAKGKPISALEEHGPFPEAEVFSFMKELGWREDTTFDEWLTDEEIRTASVKMTKSYDLEKKRQDLAVSLSSWRRPQVAENNDVEKCNDSESSSASDDDSLLITTLYTELNTKK